MAVPPVRRGARVRETPPPATVAIAAKSARSERIAVLFVKPRQRDIEILKEFYDALSIELKKRGLTEVPLEEAASAHVGGDIYVCLKNGEEQKSTACIVRSCSNIIAKYLLIIDANTTATGEFSVKIALVEKKGAILRKRLTVNNAALVGDRLKLARDVLEDFFKPVSLDLSLDNEIIPLEPFSTAGPPPEDITPRVSAPEVSHPPVTADTLSTGLALADLNGATVSPPSPTPSGLPTDVFVNISPLPSTGNDIFRRFRVPLILGGSVVVTGVAVGFGSYYGLSALINSDAAKVARRKSEAMARYEESKSDAFAANVSFGTAVVATIGTGALLYLFGESIEAK